MGFCIREERQDSALTPVRTVGFTRFTTLGREGVCGQKVTKGKGGS